MISGPLGVDLVKALVIPRFYIWYSFHLREPPAENSPLRATLVRLVLDSRVDYELENGKPLQQSDRVISALIVDDDPGIQDMVSLAIELNWPKSNVYTAADGLTGLDLAREHTPDVVILDLGLPDIDGLEVCEKLRAESSIPIVMLTARDREIDIVKGLNAGADDYVTKPFSHLQFLARL